MPPFKLRALRAPSPPALGAGGGPTEAVDHQPRSLSIADVVSLGPAAFFIVVATCSLALAHAHHHTLAGVIITTAVVVLLGLIAARRLAGPVRITGDRAGLVALGLCGVVAALMFLPGFSYGVTDKDPGGYVAHGVEIAHHGSYSFIDPVLAYRLPVQTSTPGVLFNGVWVRNQVTGNIVPQFYHLWPAMIATAFDVGGYGGITGLTPLAGILGVLVLVGLVRRLTRSAVAAGLAGLLMATNMLQVFQSKTPSTEVFAELIFLTLLASLALAIQQRWTPAAFVAGLLVDVSFLNRGDAWLLVMLAIVGIAVAWVLRRFDHLVLAFALGLVALLPYALWQAYAAAKDYSTLNAVPSLTKTAELTLALAGMAVVGRLILKRPAGWLTGTLSQRRNQLVVGLAFCALVFAMLTLGFERPRLFGRDYFQVGAHRLRSYDEQIMARLTWFITLPGFALAGLGVAVVALRRWSAAAWLAILPGIVLFPVFAYRARIATRLMWWTRRYVSYGLPVLLLLMGLALGFGLLWQWRGRRVLRGPAVLAAAAIIGLFLGQSLPLRHHDEWHGSFGVTQQMAALSGGKQGVYLFEDSVLCCDPAFVFAAPLWLERDELSAMLPLDPATQTEYLRSYRAAFPGHPLFVVWTGQERPPQLASVGLSVAGRFTGSFPYWEETNEIRPQQERVPPIDYDFAVYRVDSLS